MPTGTKPLATCLAMLFANLLAFSMPNPSCAQSGAFAVPHGSAESRGSGGPLRERLRQRFAKANAPVIDGAGEKFTLAGLDVAVWRPDIANGRVPLVVFSHGFHGRNNQSIFIMRALAKAGYLVVAPNHKDASGGADGRLSPEVRFSKASQWSDKTYQGRGEDIKRLLDALHASPHWNALIDWSKVALSGHSLGGYTAMSLAGAWPSWKLPGVKAVLALSPYSTPFLKNGDLKGMAVPVMYQTGTRDFGIAPALTRSNGVFSKSSSPAYLVEFEKAGHLAWTNFNGNKSQQDLINSYAVAFLDKFVKGDATARPELQREGVEVLAVK